MKKIAIYVSGVVLAAAASFATYHFASVKSGAGISVKSTPASRALNDAAQDALVKQKQLDDVGAAAKTKLEAEQKQNLADAQALQKELSDALKLDPKYKSYLDRMNDVQARLTAAQQKAQSDFDNQTSKIKNDAIMDQVTMKGLVPVVKKENGLPDTATFDPLTQTWSLKPPPGK